VRRYKNANIFYDADFELLKNRTLIVDGDRISGITDRSYDESIDLKGAYLLPAFIDGHSHLGDTGAKELGIGLSVEEAVSPPNGLKHRYLRDLTDEQLGITLRQGLREMLRSGIAVCADFREGGIDGVLALRRAQESLPILAIALGRPLAACGSEPNILEEELERLMETADGLGISSINAFPLGIMKKVREFARDKTFAIHVAESREGNEQSIARYGANEIERSLNIEPDFMVHLTQATETDIERLAARGARIVCCPRTNCILGDGIPPLDAFSRAGLDWGIGSDNVMFTSPDIFREMDFASRVVCGLKERPDCIGTASILRAATISGAKALGIDSEFGTIKENKSASFIAISADSETLKFSNDILSSIVHRASAADIDYFLCRGTEVIRNGRFLL
jgi:cytosine/adenosine deaminase-related metal-dependent hydrolase